jgi:hypothetical protein
MKNVIFTLIATAAIVFTSCSGLKKEAEKLNGSHKVVVKEVLQVNAYTYMNVTENKKDQWIAVPKMEAQVGDTYYFDSFVEMNNFESKDLGRTFESVYFIQEVRTELAPVGHEDHSGQAHAEGEMEMPAGHMDMGNKPGKPELVKKDIKIEPIAGGITISELYANKEKYAGKKVTIRGVVVKINMEIMDKNWFHIQDGTSENDKFDLTITSKETELNLDDELTFEGTITLNKDFGYGYSYEVLMEEGVIVK